MKRRCMDDPVKNPDYDNYAGRGIRFEPGWEEFENFLKDMGESPPDLELERIDNNGNYGPKNCRWATRSDQTRNTRKTVYYIINGEKMDLRGVSEKYKIRYTTLRSRVYCMKLSIEEAISYVRP